MTIKVYRYMVPPGESLRQKQSRFVRMVGDLIAHAYGTGYELTFGHALRCPECQTGKKKSLHKERLAVDFNLFKDGRWLAMTEDFRSLGTFWEELAEDAAWGGHFNDGNHFSLAHGGRK